MIANGDKSLLKTPCTCRYFGYQKDYLGTIVGILCGFTAFFWFISVVCLKFLNFQRR